LKVSDQDKIAFITPHDIYCYTAMVFDLKNAGATYEKAIQKCLESQIGKNVEAYIDDVVVKTTAEDNLIADLAQTFANLWRYRWKLNPEKCVFSVPSGKLLGFMVSHRGIEANHTKVGSIRKMKRPTGKKDVMKLTVMMVALGRFISKLGGERPALLQDAKKVRQVRMDRRGRSSHRRVEDLPHHASGHGAPAPKETLLLYISTSAWSWWQSNLKKVTPIPSSDPSTMSARSYLIAKSGTRNPRRCCTFSSSPHTSCGTTYSRTKSRSSPASPWERFYIVMTPEGASSSGQSS
jgi:hypothetical protein